MTDMKTILGLIAEGQSLTFDQSRAAFEIMMSGEATHGQIGAFLMGLRARGESVDEITGGVHVMRARATRVSAPENAIDTCGTGGDGSGSLNISTAATFVVAGAGVPIAKHGNKALSSITGSAEVLVSLGVKLDVEPSKIEQCIREAGVGFMMAPFHHSAMKHVGPVRVELGFRTIFNMMGPLSNPAGTKRQLIGVFSKAWLEPMAHVLKNLGSEKVWLVNGSDGLDEMTTTGPTHVVELNGSDIRSFEINPQDLGLSLAEAEDLKGGEADYNAQRLSALLDGEKDAYRDIVLLNSAAALVVADKVKDLKEGMDVAATAIDTGAGKAALQKLVELSNA